jgi:hypothetical protein
LLFLWNTLGTNRKILTKFYLCISENFTQIFDLLDEPGIKQCYAYAGSQRNSQIVVSTYPECKLIA